MVTTLVKNGNPAYMKWSFADTNGVTHAIVALRSDQLMTLYRRPAKQSA